MRLEGRVVPLVRARSVGISALTSLPHNLNRWTELAGVDAEPLAERLAWLQRAPSQRDRADHSLPTWT